MGVMLTPPVGITPKATKRVTSDNNTGSRDDVNDSYGYGGLVGVMMEMTFMSEVGAILRVTKSVASNDII